MQISMSSFIFINLLLNLLAFFSLSDKEVSEFHLDFVIFTIILFLDQQIDDLQLHALIGLARSSKPATIKYMKMGEFVPNPKYLYTTEK